MESAIKIFVFGGFGILGLMLTIFIILICSHGQKGKEKRRCLRMEVELPVSYTISDSKITGKVTDISATGLCLTSVTKFKKEDTLHIEITLPNDKIVHVKTEVKWVTQINEKFKTGLAIIPTGSVSEALYIKFCAKKMWKK